MVLSAVLLAIVAPAVRSLWEMVQSAVLSAILSEFGYLWNYDDNVGNLGQEVQMLENLKNELVRRVECPPEGHEIKDIFKKWLESVGSIIGEAMTFLEDEKNAPKRCLRGLCLNLILRYQLGKQAKNTTDEIVRLKKQGRREFENKILTEYFPSLAPKFKNEGYEEFKSRKSTLEEIKQALSDPSTNVIGIWGMPGIGKTMLVKEVANNCKVEQLFDNVVMAVVSKDPDIIEIQGQIADGLGLKFDRESNKKGRAHQLRERLKDEKTSNLVILDNIWKKLNLEEVGIPLGGNSKKCKLVLTSTSRKVLSDDMNAKAFEIGLLHEDEAWDLFQKRAGHSANDPELKDTATEVAKKCSNLPLAIETIATALKNKDLPIWRDALREQRMSTPTNIPGINAEAYNSLKWCYDSMKDNKEENSLLSLCCLFPEDHHISIQDILKHGKGLDLFGGIETLEEERDKVIALVDRLKGSSLLRDGDTTGFFKIHAEIRAVVISIWVASRQNDILVVRNGVEWEELEGDELENRVAMSLPSIDICDLRRHGQGLQCPKLQLLLWLSKDQYSLENPDTFFEGMEKLKVLNLTNIVFSSLASLSNLQTLCLEKCKLRDLSRIGELENLKKLSFRESDIETLPAGIGQLTRLWLLDLSHCSNLKTIQSDVIARLTRLEELYMGNSSVNWEVGGNASLVELKHLSRLVALEIGITDANILLPEEFPFKELKRYKIFVGGDWDWSGDYETSKTLKLKLNTSILQKGINMLLGSTEVLYLDELNETSTVLYHLDREGFPHLKHLHVQRSRDIQYVIESEEQDPSCKAFPELESLFLSDLSRLTDICHGQPPEGSFCKLKFLKVERCATLEKVLKMSMAGLRERLQEVVVGECVELKVIVANNEADKITFPQLHSLKLKCLPVLVSFCAKVKTVIHSPNYAGEITPEGEPHIPIPFFNKKVAFQNLKLLNIECCDSLRNLFSPSMANDLVKLQALKIINCRMMEEIVEKEKGVEEEAIDKIVFRLLSYITLQGLPELTSFYPGDQIFECPSLQKLTIDGCPRIKKFTSTYEGLQVTFGEGDLNAPSSPLFDEKVVFPNLEFLMIENVNSLKEIWSSQLPVDDDSFCKLKSLYLHDCEHLLNIFPSHMLMRLQNLTSLLVTTCQNLKHIFTTSIANSLVQLQELKIGNSGKVEEIVEKERVEEESMVRIVFPQLTSLHFWGLPKLNSFGQGIFTSDWTSLKTLNVSGSDNVETLALELSRFEQSGGKGHVSTPMKQPLFLVDKVAFPNLEDLELSSISNMKESLIDRFHAASFGKLTVLKVRDCHSLKHLLSLTIAKSLVQIKRIIIENCGMMKEVVASDEAEETNETTFSQLISLQLIKLPNLRSFCAKSNTFSFLSLEEVLVEECPKMKTFCNEILETPKLEKVHTQFEYRGEVFDEGIWKGDLNTTIQYMFEQKVEFLRFSELSELKQICHDQFPVEACVVQYLVVENCTSLLNVVSSNMLESLRKLEIMTVQSCDSLEQVFDLEGLNYEEKHNGLISNLEELNLTELPKLRCIWNKDPEGILSFRNLRWLNIHKCHSLRNMFSPSMVPYLTGLEELKITDCLHMEEIIGEEKGAKEEAIDKIEFYLVYVELQDLPDLTSFYPGNHTLRCPRLKTLKIARCRSIKTFTSTNEGVQESIGDGNVDVPSASLFIDKVAFPNLEDLELSSMSNMKESLIDRFHAASFGKLTVLKVRDCQSLKHLLSLTIAKSLVQIKRIIIENCDMMKEVVASDEVEQTNETTFSQLISVQLIKLPNLRSFCARSNTFSFLSLEEVLVEECPKMKTFCNGILETPKLEKVHTQFEYRGEVFDEGIWKGDLNTTIRYMFEQKVEFLTFSELSELKQICHDQFTVEACVVEYLVVENCTSLLNVVSSNMLESLRKLEIMTVQSCDSLEQVFDLGGLNYEEKHNGLISNLEELNLTDLPKLRCIWNKDPEGILSFRNLRWLSIHKCHSLRNMFSPSMVPYLTGLERLKIKDCLNMEEIIGKEKRTKEEAIDKIEFIDKVAFPNLEELNLSKLSNMKEIWQGQFRAPLVSKLRVLKVKNCKKISKVLPSQDLPYVQELSITNCDMVQEIFGGEGAQSMNKMTFPQLTSLSLSQLGQLERFCHATDKMVFPQLISLSLSQLELLKSFCQATERMVFPQLTSLSLSHLAQLDTFCQATDNIVFPELTSLTLNELKQLKRFHQGNHISEWPSLKILKVTCCLNVQIFASELSGFKENLFRQPLFFVGKVAFPNLEELQLSYLDEMKKIWHGQFHEPSISNLRVLKVDHCRQISQVFPISSIQNLQKLEELSVEMCHTLKHIVGEEGDEEKITDKIMLPQLTSLSLSSLWELKSFCQGIPISEWASLKKLTLFDCEKVKIFAWEFDKEMAGTPVVPPEQPLFLTDKVAFHDLESVTLTNLPNLKEIWGGQFYGQSLCNLTTLIVSFCGSLTYLLPFAVAKSLVQIQRIEVIDCERMKEIITIEEGEATDEITFSRLDSLYLSGLENLTSFCRGSNTLSLPSSVTVTIGQCPKLKTFSYRILNTPKTEQSADEGLLGMEG